MTEPKKRYFVHFLSTDEAEYVLGNETLVELEDVHSFEEAEKVVFDPEGDVNEEAYIGCYSEPSVTEAEILEVTATKELDVPAWREGQKKVRAERARIQREKDERAQYERLKQKFEGP